MNMFIIEEYITYTPPLKYFGNFILIVEFILGVTFK